MSDCVDCQVGEGRAHIEAADRYGLKLTCVGGSCRAPPQDDAECSLYHKNSVWGAIFRVDAIGARSDIAIKKHGFEMSVAEQYQYKATNKLCRSTRADGSVYTLRSESTAERIASAAKAGKSGVRLQITSPIEGDPWVQFVQVFCYL